jgi:hypothetical protein
MGCEIGGYFLKVQQTNIPISTARQISSSIHLTIVANSVASSMLGLPPCPHSPISHRIIDQISYQFPATLAEPETAQE